MTTASDLHERPPADDAAVDAMFAALASAPRRAIVTHLAAGATTTPELGRRFSFSKQALNRHLVALEDTGIVRRQLVGRTHEVRLEPARLETLTTWAEQVHAAWSSNLDRLGDVLDELARAGIETPADADDPADRRDDVAPVRSKGTP